MISVSWQLHYLQQVPIMRVPVINVPLEREALNRKHCAYRDEDTIYLIIRAHTFTSVQSTQSTVSY